MILRRVTAIRALTHVYVVPHVTSAKDSPIALHAAMFLAMPLAFLCVQAVRSIAWRSDQTAKNCLLTPPPALPRQHLLKRYTKCLIQTDMRQMPPLESDHTFPHARAISKFSIFVGVAGLAIILHGVGLGPAPWGIAALYHPFSVRLRF